MTSIVFAKNSGEVENALDVFARHVKELLLFLKKYLNKHFFMREEQKGLQWWSQLNMGRNFKQMEKGRLWVDRSEKFSLSRVENPTLTLSASVCIFVYSSVASVAKPFLNVQELLFLTEKVKYIPDVMLSRLEIWSLCFFIHKIIVLKRDMDFFMCLFKMTENYQMVSLFLTL